MRSRGGSFAAARKLSVISEFRCRQALLRFVESWQVAGWPSWAGGCGSWAHEGMGERHSAISEAAGSAKESLSNRIRYGDGSIPVSAVGSVCGRRARAHRAACDLRRRAGRAGSGRIGGHRARSETWYKGAIGSSGNAGADAVDVGLEVVDGALFMLVYRCAPRFRCIGETQSTRGCQANGGNDVLRWIRANFRPPPTLPRLGTVPSISFH